MAERQLLGLDDLHAVKEVRAVSCYSKRPPKKGEWYLSGAIPVAHRARANLTDEFWIYRLVRVKEVMTYEIVCDPFKRE